MPVPVHEATVLWDGIQQSSFALATGHEPLVGMTLIYGSRLTLESVGGGSLTPEGLL